MSNNIHLIGLFRKALNYALTHKIMFGEVIPRMINDWYEKAIQLDTNWREATAIFGSNSNKKNENKTTNRTWYRPAEKKDPNAMDVDALTFEERQVLMKEGKCFKCRKTGHRISELFCLNQGYSRIIFCFSNPVTKRLWGQVCPLIVKFSQVYFIIVPHLFGVPSILKL